VLFELLLPLSLFRPIFNADINAKRVLFLWAATTLTSRSFTSNVFVNSGQQDFPVLCPVLDIFNHNSSAKVKWQFQGGMFSLLLEQMVQAGQQVFNMYAPKGNEERMSIRHL
jgi:hypothetical protein